VALFEQGSGTAQTPTTSCVRVREPPRVFSRAISEVSILTSAVAPKLTRPVTAPRDKSHTRRHDRIAGGRVAIELGVGRNARTDADLSGTSATGG